MDDFNHYLKTQKDRLNGTQENGVSRLNFRKASDIEETEIKWLWEDMIPAGQLSLIAGESGVGKTSLLCNFAAVVSRGGCFPGAKQPCRKSQVIFLTGEDGISDTIISRLRLSDAYMDNVQILDANVGEKDYFNVHEHLSELEAAISNMDEVGLIIIDPITAFMGANADTNQVGVVRPVATKLKILAERTGAAVMILNHLGKNNNAPLAHRILGSSAWVQAPRAVLIAMEHPEHGNVLGIINSNIASQYGVYPYSLTNKDGDDPQKYYAEFSDTPLPLLKMKELIDCDINPEHGNKTDRAIKIIAEVLADGKQHPKEEVVNACLNEGISTATVKKCANIMDVTFDVTNTVPPKGLWSLELASNVN